MPPLTLTLSAALSLTCTAPVAVDGDTLRCRNLGPVRLLAIDAPELPGHCRKGRACTPGDGLASKRALASLIRRRTVTCEPAGRDAYRRILARCTAGRRDLSCAMVATGFAVQRYGALRCPR